MRPTSLTRHDQNNLVARAIDPVRILASLLMAVAIKVVTRDVIGFGVFNGACILTAHLFFGWPVSLWNGLSVTVTSLAAHYYLSNLYDLRLGARTATVRLRASGATRRLRKLRTRLIAEIESARRKVPTEALAPTEGEAK